MDPVRVAVCDEHELVVAGASGQLALFPDRVRLVPWDDLGSADVVLYGVRDQVRGHDSSLHSLLRTSTATTLVFGWREDDPPAQLALTCGARGFVSKTLTAAHLVETIEYLYETRDLEVPLPASGECHPGVQDAALTPREIEVVGLIASGWSNAEIAATLFLSINSVKTYIRTAYQKMGVERRSQAVLWADEHGLVEESLLHRVGAPAG